jgi:MFS family permease
VETVSVLRQRNFALLWFGQAISLVGDWVLFIALPFYIFSLTGSALATSVMFIAMTLPRLLFGSLAGVFVDRWDRRKTMIAADLLRAAILLLLLVVRSREWIWLIYVTAFVESVISQFFIPAKSAIIPRLVGERDLLTANSLNALSDSLTRLVGPALGGALMSWLGLNSVVFVDVASYLISALMIMLIILPAATPAEPTPATPGTASAPWSAVWREWLDGLRLVKKERLVTAIFATLGVALFADSIITVLIVPFVKEVMRSDAQRLGWLMTAQGVGGIIGGLLIGQLGTALPQRRLVPLGLGTTAVVLVVIVNWPILPLALALMALGGVAVMAWVIGSETLLQVSVADQFRGRIFGTLGTTSALMSLGGMGLAGALGDFLGVVRIMSIAAGLYFVSGMVAWVMLRQPKPEPATLTFQSEPARD